MTKLLFQLLVPCAAIMLATPLLVHADFPSVTGTVFHDADESGAMDPGEGVEGVTLHLFADDGDGVFDAVLDSMVATHVSDGVGTYAFTSLGVGANYFIQQAPYEIGGVTLPGSVSSLISPNSFNRMIDDFEDQQVLDANPIIPLGRSNLTSSTVIGGQRDMVLEYLSGPAESTLRANPYGLNEVLEFDQTAGVISVATVTWDGVDADFSTIPAAGGLGGIDFTIDGSDAFAFNLGIDAAGADERLLLRVYSGSEVSTAVVDLTVTGGEASIFQIVPFDSFVGNASFSSVDAVQLEIGGTQPSVDAQIGPIGLIGPAVHDFAVPIPEPSAMLLGLFAMLCMFGRRSRRAPK